MSWDMKEESLCPEGAKCPYFGTNCSLISITLGIWEESRPTPVTHLKFNLVETSPWFSACIEKHVSAHKRVLALGGNLTFTRSSLLRRSMTLMMKSLAIWKFCRPMLSELSNTKRRSTGPQVHSAARHRSREACVFCLSSSFRASRFAGKHSKASS